MSDQQGRPTTDTGRWLDDHQGLVNISKPAHRSMRGDEIDLRAAILTIEREAYAAGAAGVTVPPAEPLSNPSSSSQPAEPQADCGYECPFTKEAHDNGDVGHEWEFAPPAEPLSNPSSSSQPAEPRAEHHHQSFAARDACEECMSAIKAARAEPRAEGLPPPAVIEVEGAEGVVHRVWTAPPAEPHPDVDCGVQEDDVAGDVGGPCRRPAGHGGGHDPFWRSASLAELRKAAWRLTEAIADQAAARSGGWKAQMDADSEFMAALKACRTAVDGRPRP